MPNDRIERKLTKNEDDTYDYTIDENGDFTPDLSFDTDILVSLFVDARADESEISEPSYRRGWIGDVVTVLQGHQLGSKIWLTEQERMTQDVLNKIRSYVKESLNWVITLDYGQRVQVEVNREDLTSASVNIRIYVKNDNVLKFSYQIWQNSEYAITRPKRIKEEAFIYFTLLSISGNDNVNIGNSFKYTAETTSNAQDLTYFWEVTGTTDAVINGSNIGECVIVDYSGVDGDPNSVANVKCTANSSSADKEIESDVDVTITHNYLNSVTVSGQTPVNIGESETYTTAVDTNMGDITYLWTITGTTDAVINGSNTGASVDIDYSGTGGVSDSFADIKCVVTSVGFGGSVEDTLQATIEHDYLDSVTVSGQTPVNYVDSEIYTANVNSNLLDLVYLWTVTGTPDAVINGSNTGSTVVIDYSGIEGDPDAFADVKCVVSSPSVAEIVDDTLQTTIKHTILISVVIGGNVPANIGQSHVYTTTVDPNIGSLDYLWTVTGTTDAVINGSNTGSTVTVDYAGTGGDPDSFADVKCVVSSTTSGNVVEDTVSVTIGHDYLASVTVTGDTPVNISESETYVANVDSFGIGFSYLWTVTGTTDAVINGSNNNQTVDVDYSGTGGDPDSFADIKCVVTSTSPSVVGSVDDTLQATIEHAPAKDFVQRFGYPAFVDGVNILRSGIYVTTMIDETGTSNLEQLQGGKRGTLSGGTVDIGGNSFVEYDGFISPSTDWTIIFKAVAGGGGSAPDKLFQRSDGGESDKSIISPSGGGSFSGEADDASSYSLSGTGSQGTVEAVQKDGNTMRLYKDGVLISTDAVSVNDVFSLTTLKGYSGGLTFSGYVMYNRALTALEIQKYDNW